MSVIRIFRKEFIGLSEKLTLFFGRKLRADLPRVRISIRGVSGVRLRVW